MRQVQVLSCSGSFTDEPPHDKTNKMPSPPSQIRDFAVRMKKLGGCPGWSEYSLGAHTILLVLSWGGSDRYYGVSSCHPWSVLFHDVWAVVGWNNWQYDKLIFFPALNDHYNKTVRECGDVLPSGTLRIKLKLVKRAWSSIKFCSWRWLQTCFLNGVWKTYVVSSLIFITCHQLFSCLLWFILIVNVRPFSVCRPSPCDKFPLLN